MKQLFAILFLTALFVGIVMAHEGSSLETELSPVVHVDTEGLSDQQIVDIQKQQIQSHLSDIQSSFNEHSDELPPMASRFFGSEKVNLIFDGDITVGVVMKGGKIVTMESGALDKPSMLLYVHDPALLAIQANNFDFGLAMKERTIEIRGSGFFGKLKFGFLRRMFSLVAS